VAVAMLEAEGHTVEAVSRGGEALERLARGGVEVVLTDRAMPEMRGDQLAAAAKLLDARVGVVMMTGFGDMMNAAGERPSGVDAVLGKPISRAPLLAALETAGGALLPL
jgi:CheY-like chemotaxis protein